MLGLGIERGGECVLNVGQDVGIEKCRGVEQFSRLFYGAPNLHNTFEMVRFRTADDNAGFKHSVVIGRRIASPYKAVEMVEWDFYRYTHGAKLLRSCFVCSCWT